MRRQHEDSVRVSFLVSRRLYDILLTIASQTDREFSDTVASLCWVAWAVLEKPRSTDKLSISRLLKCDLNDRIIRSKRSADLFDHLQEALRLLLD